MADKGADRDATKKARREFVKHKIDITRADLRVMHGVLYLRGQVAAESGAEIPDLKAEVERVGRLVRQIPEIRDVAIDVLYRR